MQDKEELDTLIEETLFFYPFLYVVSQKWTDAGEKRYLISVLDIEEK